MSDTTNISQNASLGAQGNTFVGEQHNYSGLSPVDATQMAFTIFREYYPQLRQEALNALYEMVQEKLNKIQRENIIPPNPRVVVPTLQNASFTEDQEIRELYAELLAKSMDQVIKDNVHPSFVEIINQLCPDEAKILRYFKDNNMVPTVTLKFVNEDESGISIIKNFSCIGEIVKCEKPLKICAYFDNLVRLGLLRVSSPYSRLKGEYIYEPLQNHPFLKQFTESKNVSGLGFKKTSFDKGYMELTDYGKSFCEICVNSD